MRRILLVAACTDRKRGVTPDSLRLRAVAAGEVVARATAWWGRLASAHPDLRAPAAATYVGEHWRLVQTIQRWLRRTGWHADLWIASAGYGLLAEAEPIIPYSCTFADGSPDQVALGVPACDRVAYNQRWWRALAELRGARDEPRGLAALAARSEDAGILVMCSPAYVRALHEDLAQALALLRRPERLVIVTSGARWQASPLRSSIVTVDARVRSAFGGTMLGLHARSALNVLFHAGAARRPLCAREFRASYRTMVREIERVDRPARASMPDEEVVAFLRAELTNNPRAGWTRLLRALRDSGRACEQRRFRRLHTETARARADEILPP